MRVLVVGGRVGSCGPVEAGRALGVAFAQARTPSPQVAVVPAAAGGADLRDALDALGHPSRLLADADPQALGRALAAELAGVTGRLLIDLTPLPDQPSSAILLAAGLGITPGEAARLPELRRLAGGADLAGVIPTGQAGDLLLGPQGVAARQGYAAGEQTLQVVRRDDDLKLLASTLEVRDAPGLGAAGGAAAVLVGLGGRLATGFALVREGARLDDALARADLVVVASDTFTTGDFGGPIVIELAAAASDIGVPVLAIARETEIGQRELRRYGVQAAQRLGGGPELGASEITERARTIAASWTW